MDSSGASCALPSPGIKDPNSRVSEESPYLDRSGCGSDPCLAPSHLHVLQEWEEHPEQPPDEAVLTKFPLHLKAAADMSFFTSFPLQAGHSMSSSRPKIIFSNSFWQLMHMYS
jgi:hypothetical protein